jgi:hypothetical protein
MRAMALHFLPITIAFTCMAGEPAPKSACQIDQFIGFGYTFFKSINAKPTSHKVKRTKSQYAEGRFDKWHTLTYPGFKVEYHWAAAVPRKQLSSLVITAPSIKLPCDIKIGDTQSRITGVFGSPASETVDSLDYKIGADIQSSMAKFRFNKGLLVAIEWSYEID